MIQGRWTQIQRDPDQSKWGQGDAGYDLVAEFNDIKHNRGIVFNG